MQLITLLRLSYQLQLGPIFAWGFLLGGGRLTHLDETARFLAVFALFHIGAFGGLTALNSWYDRDTGPIGGLWNPPSATPHLFAFAWTVQLGGLVLLLLFGWNLCVVYALILLLSLGYSHPRTRWKGHPFKSVAVVALGQGALDFAAGALTARPHEYSYQPQTAQNALRWLLALDWPPFVWWGMLGATLTVIGFYPLTQLYQIKDDARRGDDTLAACLARRGGRGGVFVFVAIWVFAGAVCNALALAFSGHRVTASVLWFGSLPTLWFLWLWHRDTRISTRDDFRRVHGLMRCMALAFDLFLLWMLARGGLQHR